MLVFLLLMLIFVLCIRLLWLCFYVVIRVLSPLYAMESERMMHERWVEGRGHAGGKKSYVSVRETLFWHIIHCTNPMTIYWDHSGCWSVRRMRRQSLLIMR